MSADLGFGGLLAGMFRDRPELRLAVLGRLSQQVIEDIEGHLDSVHAYLGKPIIRLNGEASFDHWSLVKTRKSIPASGHVQSAKSEIGTERG